jgi:hypothetical protein
LNPKLPKFEGEQPQAASLRLSGRSDERVGALAREEEVYLIVRAVVNKITHGDESGVLTRVHHARATTVILMERDQGERILDEATMLANEQFGIRDLFNQDGEA